MVHEVESYYRFHARFYDATRWAFLFGREELLRQVAHRLTPRRVLEVGCGTGRNLRRLAELFPAAGLTGVDLSPDMLARAERNLNRGSDRIRLRHGEFPQVPAESEPFDLVLFSYSLSMINPGWKDAIAAALSGLNEGGVLAVVDFHDSPFAGFNRWMSLNHVRVGGHLLEELRGTVGQGTHKVSKAFLGTWRFFTFVS
jgi:S-adenosylmethionine-diacylgycerolhomoserine-N-methlytransferase